MIRKLSIRARLKKFQKRLKSPKQRKAWLATLRRVMLPHVTYIGVTGSCAKTTTTRLIGTVLERAVRCRTADANGIPPLSRNILSVGVLTRETESRVEVATEPDERPSRGARTEARLSTLH